MFLSVHKLGYFNALSLFHSLSFLVLSRRLVAAAVSTVTIDDTYGDALTGALPVYAPPASWSKGMPCIFDDSCFVNPDPKQVHNGTWHDSVGRTSDASPRTIDISFEGTSISVYCIIPEVDRVEIAVANMTFEVDGAEAGRFYHDPSGQMDTSGNYNIAYDIMVFDSSTLPQNNHTLLIISVGYSRMLFDYAQYTTDKDDADPNTPTPTPPSTDTGSKQRAAGSVNTQSASGSHLPVIIGAIVAGSIALLGVVAALMIILIRGRRRRARGTRAHHLDSLKHDRRFHGKDDIDSRSYVSSAVSVTLERAPTPFFPYHDTRRSSFAIGARSNGDLEQQPSANTSPTDSIPLTEFPTPPSLSSHTLPRIVVTGEETRLVGPDNSMARYARQKVAEREEELTRRMREMEAALAAKYGDPLARSPTIASAATTTASIPAGSSPSTQSGGDGAPAMESGSQAVLLRQMVELREEIQRMRVTQQHMALELREATESPPEYR